MRVTPARHPQVPQPTRTNAGPAPRQGDLLPRLHRSIGNQRVLRLLGNRPGGHPLPHDLRSRFEPRFGQDLGGVRVHRDGPATQAARTMGALAYTVGNHIVFGEGQYRPGTPVGDRILAHEIAHVLQQQREAQSADGSHAPFSAGSDHYEAEAHRVSRAVALGHSAAVTSNAPLYVARLARPEQDARLENVQTLSDADLASEYAAVREWLIDHAASDPEFLNRQAYFSLLESEVSRRNPARIAGESRRRALVKEAKLAPLVTAPFGIPAMFGGAASVFFTEFAFGLRDAIAEQPPARQTRLLARFEQLQSLTGNWGDKLDYWTGYGKGIALGVWGEIEGVVDLFLLVAGLQGRANQWVDSLVSDPQRAQALLAKGILLKLELDALMSQVVEDIVGFFRDPAQVVETLSGLLDGVLAAGLEKAYEMGHGAVDSVFQFLEQPYRELGEGVGKVTGIVLFNVVLFVATDAIGNLITKGASLLARMGRAALEGVAEVANTVRLFVGKIVTFLKTAGRTVLRAFEGSLESLGRLFRSVEEFFAELAELSSAERALAGGPKVPTNVLSEAQEARVPRGSTTTTVEKMRPPTPLKPKDVETRLTELSNRYKEADLHFDVAKAREYLRQRGHTAEALDEIEAMARDTLSKRHGPAAQPSLPEPEPAPPTSRPAREPESLATGKRTWRVSEVDAQTRLTESYGAGWEPQQRFGAPGAAEGESLGSTIPEFYNKRLNVLAEVKNLELSKLDESVRGLQVQLARRVWSGPKGAKNWIIFDVRGQVVADLRGTKTAMRRFLTDAGIGYDSAFLLHDGGLALVP
jgi:hypothetical protein